MRKVFLKIILLILFALSISGSFVSNAKADQPDKIEVVSEEDYIIQKIYIGNFCFIVIFTKDGKLVQILPEETGSHGNP